ncbi:hypothetical protein H3C61_02915 [Candidatus Gracilibacteria bacterium]|nr:hypothetical protein [Candidatus Gracilibacteria bacterium]
MSNDLIYNWSFSSEKQRGNLWYIIALSIIIGLVVWGFFTRQYIFSILVILVTGVYFFVENNSESLITVQVTNLGIKVNNFFYDFSKIENYSIIYSGENAILLRLELGKKGLRYLNLQIDNNIALNLKQILPNFLNENENGELTFNEKIIKLLKL